MSIGSRVSPLKARSAAGSNDLVTLSDLDFLPRSRSRTDEIAFRNSSTESYSVRVAVLRTKYSPPERPEEARDRRMRHMAGKAREVSRRAFWTRQRHVPSDEVSVHAPHAAR